MFQLSCSAGWLARIWNWKSAVLSSLFRAIIFFFANWKAGSSAAMAAMLAKFLCDAASSGLAKALLVVPATRASRHRVRSLDSVPISFLPRPPQTGAPSNDNRPSSGASRLYKASIFHRFRVTGLNLKVRFRLGRYSVIFEDLENAWTAMRKGMEPLHQNTQGA